MITKAFTEPSRSWNEASSDAEKTSRNLEISKGGNILLKEMEHSDLSIHYIREVRKIVSLFLLKEQNNVH